MGTIECLSQYAGKVDPPTARRAGLLAPRFTLAEAIEIADHLAHVTAERDALRADVEAMRGVVDDACRHLGGIACDLSTIEGKLQRRAWLSLDALRARKVGG